MASLALLRVLAWVLFAPASQTGAPDQVLRSEKIVAAEPDAEFHLKIRARAPGTSWDRKERPGALLKIFVDDRYDQHVFLVGGGRDMDYNVLLGPLAPGEHRLRIDWDNSWTPALETAPEILAVDLTALKRADPAQEPILRAPILYIRSDTVARFSDAPLVLYWEREKDEVTYTVIFSNEDGGTNTERLMARWGRTTDIEWCYRYSKSGNSFERDVSGARSQDVAISRTKARRASHSLQCHREQQFCRRIGGSARGSGPSLSNLCRPRGTGARSDDGPLAVDLRRDGSRNGAGRKTRAARKSACRGCLRTA